MDEEDIMRHERVLVSVIRERGIKAMVEVGVWKSRSLKGILRSEVGKEMKEYWAVDTWSTIIGEGHCHMSELTEGEWINMYEYCCSLMCYFPQLRVLRMSSQRASEMFRKSKGEKYFDFVYLDANHFYDDVVKDIKSWLPMVREGGYLGGHDYDRGQHKGHQVKPAVLSFFKEEELDFYSGGTWVKRL